MNRTRVLLPAAGVVAACAAGATAWLLLTADSAVAVTPPTVSPQVAAVCAKLHGLLPASVAGQSRDTTSPSSDLTAAWGSSPIVLTCGAATPSVLDPASKNYDPSTQAVYANGVTWLPVPTASGYEFFTTQRSVYIEVFVPASYDLQLNGQSAPTMDAPTDLSPAVISGTPRSGGGTGPDVSPQ